MIPKCPLSGGCGWSGRLSKCGCAYKKLWNETKCEASLHCKPQIQRAGSKQAPLASPIGAVHTLRPSRSVSGGMIKNLARSPHHVPRSGIESPKSSIVPSLAEVALGGLVRLYSFNNVAANRIAQVERIKKASGWCSRRSETSYRVTNLLEQTDRREKLAWRRV